jgi:cation transport ATPase
LFRGIEIMKKKFILEGLGCANCAAKMERAINKLAGVKEATVNFMTQKLIIEGEDEKMPEIVQEAEKIIKKIESQVVMKKA